MTGRTCTARVELERERAYGELEAGRDSAG